MRADSPLTRPGRPYPLGATWDGAGVNFALFSDHATGLDLCLFDASDPSKETHRIPMVERTDQVWHSYLPEGRPGLLYGYRADGPYEPAAGHRFNARKLLIDPYAKAIAGAIEWSDAIFGYRVGDPGEDLTRDDRDSAPFVPKSVVVDDAFTWGDDRPLRTPWHLTVIYEAHVKGFSARNPAVPTSLRGTFAGLATPASIEYLRRLGVTAVELMPVHHFVRDRQLAERGLTNYWGYNTIGFFAPDSRYASDGLRGEQVREFKQMVKALHQAGIEVILDVVYNHTAEGNHLGPTLSFRGIDNAAYYRLVANDRRYYMDYTGCGNTLDMTHPRCVQLLMDSLRYWVSEMHVDGFRFDLASALARELHEVDRLSSFFDVIHQDPLISQVKLIAEPWDVGEGGYQVGNFPPQWAEWNGKYRDCLRDYWKGSEQTLGEFGYRITGSSDLYEDDGRRPHASINFITAHDGFTLRDLVSYNDKHNEANGEDNRDGSDDNRSWNCGVEGPTDDAEVNRLRARQQRNLITSLLVSQGIPMLLGGDELGRTQHGNNNAYCQDNELSWYDWTKTDEGLLAFVRGMIAFRKEHRVFRRRTFFQGRPIHGTGVSDIAWFTPSGDEMEDRDWAEGVAKTLGVFLNGSALEIGRRGEEYVDDNFLLLFNAHFELVTFVLPDSRWGAAWEVLTDTATAIVDTDKAVLKAGEVVDVASRSTLVLLASRRVPEEKWAVHE